ncbi:hypothetical protein [Salipaludibacillus neizhouensis]|uniref:hypothetical protein n=1 Tax=Salipaludibacillus neizhouensis TaxID=885475 RepID=UPI0016042AE4|nr:hypothetical protein [Salipaludibacillus neizhouensis]
MSKYIQEAIKKKREFLIKRLAQLGISRGAIEKLTLTELEELYASKKESRV